MFRTAAPRMLVGVIALTGHLYAGVATAVEEPAPLPPTADAAELNEQGEALYLAGKYERAAALFHRAYKIEPEPTLLYNEALALEKAKRYAEALSTLQAYLRADPNVADRPALEARIGTLQVLIERLQADAQQPSPLPISVPAADRSTSWLVGPVPWFVAGIGVASIGAGVWLGVSATDSHADAQAEPTHRLAIDLQEQAETLAVGSNVALVVGGVAAAAGATLLVVGLLDDDNGDNENGDDDVALEFRMTSVHLVGEF